MELGGVFEDEQPRFRLGDFLQDGVRQRRLARAGAADDEDVRALPDAIDDDVFLRRRHDAFRHIVRERKDDARFLTDGKNRIRRARRNHGLDAAAPDGELAGKERLLLVDLVLRDRRNDGNEALGLWRLDAPSRIDHALAGTLDPERLVFVQHDFDDERIIEILDEVPHRRAQHLQRLVARGLLLAERRECSGVVSHWRKRLRHERRLLPCASAAPFRARPRAPR